MVEEQIALEVRNLSVTYQGNTTSTLALDDVSFTVRQGEFVGVMGSNGAGKSTLALSTVGIIPHHTDARLTGDILVFGLNTKEASVADIIGRGVGILFQQPDLQLISINVELEVAFPLENRGVPREEIRRRISQALKTVRLEGYEKHTPDQLSGGQKQAVCIATALALEPKLIVLDEPTSQLDPIGSDMVFQALKSINEEEGITILIMEHKADLLAQYAHRLIILDQGKKIMEGTPAEVFRYVDDLKERGIPTPQVAELATILGREWQREFSPFPIDEQTMCQHLASIIGG
ncbi:MAG: ATP-binding cassette domain-containing protein [Chloroflexi bacterium]|nr:ATP-binding cassette domain-containing protein [Chloroflexota bacterium]MCL5074431.1 ATP-binding cassette domain-containing protein [Chloroflexota bacterium]